MRKGEQTRPDYLAINPKGQVPAAVASPEDAMECGLPAILAAFPAWVGSSPALLTRAPHFSKRPPLADSAGPVEFAGRKFDDKLLADLPGSVDACGENGEFHTCVVAGPMFSHPLAVKPGARVERDGYAYCDLVL